MNQGDGSFASVQYSPATQPDSQGPTFFSGIVTDDVNADGKVDVIVSHTTDRNTGAGVINVLVTFECRVFMFLSTQRPIQPRGC